MSRHQKIFTAVATLAAVTLVLGATLPDDEPPVLTATEVTPQAAPEVDERALMQEMQRRSRQAQAERAEAEAAWYTAAAEAEARAAQEVEEELAHQRAHEAAREAEEARRAEQSVAAAAAEPVTPAAPGSNYERFLRLADCESGEWRADGTIVEGSARWDANTGNGYYGGLQFLASTWRQAGGTGLPHQHSRDTQIAIAESWLAKTSWSQWPACSRKLGYR